MSAVNLERSCQLLLAIGAGFFIFEAALHGLGLPVLQHDEIFLFTHDRYIALYALTMAGIMLLAASNLKHYRALVLIILLSILLGIGNAMLIASLGGYAVLFPAALAVDGELSGLGIAVGVWYLLTLGSFVFSTQTND